MRLDNKEMGTWRCEGGTIKEAVRRTLQEKYLSEQFDSQLQTSVDKLIDLLDFPVWGDDLKNAYNILVDYSKNGKGKQLLDKYSKLESGETVKDAVQGLSLKVRDAVSLDYIEAITKLYDSIMGSGTSIQQPTKTSVTIDEQKIKIDWDSQKKKETSPVVPPKKDEIKKGGKKKMTFTKCDTFPFKFGCKSPLIGEIQKCIGVTPSYGNFGPITLKALQDLKHDTSNGITKEIYDKILEKCGDENTSGIERTKLEPIVTPQRTLSLSGLATKIKAPELKVPTIEVDPNAFYKALVKVGYIDNVPDEGDGKKRIKYKGPDLDDEQLSKLDTSMDGMGYDRIKQLEKDYGAKYVYLKRD